MDDRNLMENMLLLEKGVCDLMMHGAIESSCPDVHQTFSSALTSSSTSANPTMFSRPFSRCAKA